MVKVISFLTGLFARYNFFRECNFENEFGNSIKLFFVKSRNSKL